MADYELEINEKDELVNKLRTSVDLLKEKFSKKSDNNDLVNFYEQQLADKDKLIAVSS
jgi:hypothetical protein